MPHSARISTHGDCSLDAYLIGFLGIYYVGLFSRMLLPSHRTSNDIVNLTRGNDAG